MGSILLAREKIKRKVVENFPFLNLPNFSWTTKNGKMCPIFRRTEKGVLIYTHKSIMSTTDWQREHLYMTRWKIYFFHEYSVEEKQ